MASRIRNGLMQEGQPKAVKRGAKTVLGVKSATTQRPVLLDVSNSSQGSGVFKKPAEPVKKVVIKPTVKSSIPSNIQTRNVTAINSKNAKVTKPARTEVTKPARTEVTKPARTEVTKPAVPAHIPPPSEPSAMDISASSTSSSVMVIDEVENVTEAFSRHLLNQVDDVDKEDTDNPQLVTCYVNDIFAYLREMELAQPIKPSYLSGSGLNGKMRSVLVDWMIEVHSQFHLMQETLFLSVALMDRFLQVQKVARDKLQLAGITSMYLACKYEEMFSPEVADFVYIADNAYAKEEIRDMEMIVLAKINFTLGRPLPLHFLRRYSKVGSANAIQHAVAKYLMELALTEYGLCHIHPSHMAAAALCVALRFLCNNGTKVGPEIWSATLVYYSKVSYVNMLPLMRKLAALAVNAPQSKLHSAYRKHCSRKFMKIGMLPELTSEEMKQFACGAL